MENEKRRIYTVVAVVAVVTVLLSCILGAAAGGTAGLLVGRRQGRLAAERAIEGMGANMPWFGTVPSPWDDEELLPWTEPEEEIPIPTPRAGWRGLEGALLQEVIAGGPAEEAGLQAGDIITSLDRTSIDRNHELPDVLVQYEPGDRVSVTFWRANQESTTLVTLGESPDTPGKAYLGVRLRMVVQPEPQNQDD